MEYTYTILHTFITYRTATLHLVFILEACKLERVHTGEMIKILVVTLNGVPAHEATPQLTLGLKLRRTAAKVESLGSFATSGDALLCLRNGIAADYQRTELLQPMH